MDKRRWCIALKWLFWSFAMLIILSFLLIFSFIGTVTTYVDVPAMTSQEKSYLEKMIFTDTNDAKEVELLYYTKIFYPLGLITYPLESDSYKEYVRNSDNFPLATSRYLFFRVKDTSDLDLRKYGCWGVNSDAKKSGYVVVCTNSLPENLSKSDIATMKKLEKNGLIELMLLGDDYSGCYKPSENRLWLVSPFLIGSVFSIIIGCAFIPFQKKKR
jgi:hypothetical protein